MSATDYFRDVTISSDQPPLAQVVHEKTGGNPFFGIQFIYFCAY
jgi:hypothetical protein